MGILGIDNRTENWKTAQYFAPFFDNLGARVVLVKRLLEPHGLNLEPGESVKLELFWHGMRDYIKREKPNDETFLDEVATIYNKRFSDLREKIEKFSGFTPPKEWNYKASNEVRVQRQGGREVSSAEALKSNLASTEVDIVLATSKHLFIGEAKDESDLGTNGNLILVHQLIREYVMAQMLVDLTVKPGSPRKKLIPFVVEGKKELRNKEQVLFMQSQGWLKKENVLSWCNIKKLAKDAS